MADSVTGEGSLPGLQTGASCYVLTWQRDRERELERDRDREIDRERESSLVFLFIKTLILLEQGPSLMTSLNRNYIFTPNTSILGIRTFIYES